MNRSVARALEKRYEEDLKTRFPYEDCFKLQKECPLLTHALIPDLDLYLSFIAGFCSSATTLSKRPKEQLSSAIPKLRLSFFETYPEYGFLANKLSPCRYRALCERLRLSEESGRDLILIMESILQR